MDRDIRLGDGRTSSTALFCAATVGIFLQVSAKRVTVLRNPVEPFSRDPSANGLSHSELQNEEKSQTCSR